jgi:hypothetical protein
MKKVLSLICMALLAGGMMLTSCTKQYTITVQASPAEAGTVTGGGTFNDQVTTTLTATPNAGYKFVKWQDGTTQNPRTITVTANETWTAYFEALPAEPTVKVAFNGTNYDASEISSKWYSNYEAWAVSAGKTSLSELPIAMFATYVTSGSASATAAANGDLGDDFAYVEYYENTYLSDGQNSYGDWWGKNITLNVNAFDATALTVSAKVNGTMFSALEAFVEDEGAVGVDAASTAPMTVDVINVKMSSAKGDLKKNAAKKLVAVK